MIKVLRTRLKSNRIINAWCSYDMANSGYSLVIATVLYPVYFATSTQSAFGNNMVNFIGTSIKNTVLYEYATSIAYLIAVVLSIVLSGIADIQGYRKRFMHIFTLVGSFACMGMYWFNGDNIILGVLLPTLAIIGFVCSFVFYNSFLPLIVNKQQFDSISARGYAFGYAGSMVLLIFVLLQIEYFYWFGFLSANCAVRTAFIEVGVWWLLLSQIAFSHLPEKRIPLVLNRKVFSHGFKQLKHVYNQIRNSRSQTGYLLAFFCFSIGVQSIMIIATLIVSVELGLGQGKLIMGIIIVQITGIIGALLIGKSSKFISDKILLIIMIGLWILICVIGYKIENARQFFILASLTGIVMGGIQSQSRAIWSKFIPAGQNNTASYFSFYDCTERLAIVVGMFCFGFIDKITGSLRLALLSLVVFFIVSMLIILRTPFSYKSEY